MPNTMKIDLDRELKDFTIDTVNIKDRFTVNCYTRYQADSLGRIMCNQKGIKFIRVMPFKKYRKRIKAWDDRCLNCKPNICDREHCLFAE